MVIFKENDSVLSYGIPIDKNCPGRTVPELKKFIDMLNDEYSTEVPINKNGNLTTPDIKGSFVRLNNNQLGIILGGEFNPVVYRGLNNDLCFMPTSKRYELFDGNERIRHSIEWMKKREFLKLISETAYTLKTGEFNIGECKYKIDSEAVAKLYNFVSDDIDITRNILVAYFYAYTYVDTIKNQVMPITDFSKYSPTLYTGSLKKLYHNTPDAIGDMSFQPFVRAKVQQSMSIKTVDNFEQIKNQFIKIDLPKSPKIAEYIYNLFDGGKALFPGDYAAKFAIQIKSSKNLQEMFFEQYCEKTETDREWLREELTDLGYTLKDTVIEISEDANYIINREIDEIIMPFISTEIVLRDY